MPSGDNHGPDGKALPSPHVELHGRLICENAEQSDLVRRHLPEHIRLTLAEDGCLSFRVEETGDPLVWTVAERFADWASFEAHQSRSRASAWWEATAAISRDFSISGPARES
ncbi:putative quinol monooxygenase [Erythrobacter mangrovi]|uniref:Antibiotic biosynthesis monooxygenase n=1 Tax=Erythrobacter mangrovi TaxID=2739433 RepID=A0A7D4ASM7_9SPHN|nr:antibiotic biosynthesis monooxygenase [Erythrobacter mangrovi]